MIMLTVDAPHMYLQRCDKVKDLGVTIDANLSFELAYHNEKVNKESLFSD